MMATVLVVASSFDASAAGLAERWAARHRVRVVTARSLSRPGWRWNLDAPLDSTLAVDDDDERIELASVLGIVTLLPGVDAGELPHIAAEDREYVAGEMTAFLVAWLNAVAANTLNPPTDRCLTGPLLHPEQWLREAARAGLPVTASSRRFGRDAEVARAIPPDRVTVSVVGGRAVRTDDRASEPLLAAAGRLAVNVRAGLLTVALSRRGGGLVFDSAAPSVDASEAAVADAMLAAVEDNAVEDKANEDNAIGDAA